ncbi:hypothetical protein BSL78_16669 [Apostichopus japonicus]|uniref:Ig-like domain-containing protein n=1 Tax=Stichopus japonicus TaxID=307972 RepID=A0A2G8KER4_STIJA|nr:hypothetical protein BSL78_16669 [Apostichopus japonicus]
MDYLRWILLFVPSVAYFFHLLLVFESQCSAQTVSLFTRFNSIVLVGEEISLRCAVSDSKPEDDITMMITDETGQQITSGSAGLDDATVYTEQTTSFIISTNQTFFCSVSWVEFTATTNLTISPLPIENTYCTSNYTDGIIVGQTVTLTCYISASVLGFISWSSDSDMSFDERAAGLVRTMTRYNRINVEPSLSQNGSVFTCERDVVVQASDIDRCSVGPINVYEELIIFIDLVVNATDPAILYPGQTKNYTCSSLPTSSVQWTTPKELDDSYIELSVIGSKITVTVPSDSNFTGDVDLFCSGNILTERSTANLTLVINPMESVPLLTLVSSPKKSAPTTSASNTVSSKPPGNSFLVVALVTVIGFLLFTLSIMFVLLYRKSRHTESNSKSVANVTSSANVGYDYCDIDTGGVATTVTSNTDATTISENSPNAKEQYSRVIINENESVAYEIPDAKMGNENPSKRTIIDKKGNESEYYENPEKFNFETNGQKERKP